MQDTDDLANGVKGVFVGNEVEKYLRNAPRFVPPVNIHDKERCCCEVVETSYDSEAKAFYIRLNQNKVERTISPIEDICNIDLDTDGQIVGIEIFER